MRTLLIAMMGVVVAGPTLAQHSIDHYLVYEVLYPFTGGLMADLHDQFGLSSVILMERDKFANPADKTHPPQLPDLQNLLFPDEHLSWWRFEQPWPYQGEVWVSNQFGSDQHWMLGPAEYLLVPAIKDQMGDIMVNQHYECYVATDAPDIGIPVNLMDQFGLLPDVIVLGGRYLCNPVEKLGPPPLVPSGPPMFPEDHLACYDISPRLVGEIRWVEDQVVPFGDIVELIQAEMLCVPSSKQLEPPATCGDGAVEGTEECDDGNTAPSDGCDASCQIETGWICTGEPSLCTEHILPTLSPWSQLALIAGLLGTGLGVWKWRGISSSAA